MPASTPASLIARIASSPPPTLGGERHELRVAGGEPAVKQLAVDGLQVFDGLGAGCLGVQEGPFDVNAEAGSLGRMGLEERADLVGRPHPACGEENP